jgi:magnesium-transporting ATPase (P-type)
MILLNNDLSSIPIAIEMGRLVFDNLKKVILYLMPVCRLRPFGLYVLDRHFTGWDVHRVHNRLCQCLPGNAACPQFLSPSVLLYHERRSHVDLFDVREVRSWSVYLFALRCMSKILSRPHAAQTPQRPYRSFDQLALFRSNLPGTRYHWFKITLHLT